MAVDLGPEPFWQAFSALLCALAAAVLVLWQCQQWGITQHPGAWTAAAAAVALSACVSWRGSFRAADRLRLEWTGREWRCRRRLRSRGPGPIEATERGAGDAGNGDLDVAGLGAEQACEPAVMMDLGAWMLLRLEATDKADGWWPSFQWLAVSQRLVGPSWHGLRVALYGAPPGRPGPSSMPPPST